MSARIAAVVLLSVTALGGCSVKKPMSIQEIEDAGAKAPPPLPPDICTESAIKNGLVSPEACPIVLPDP